MTKSFSSQPLEEWQQQAHRCLLKGNYSQVATLYEQAIEADPTVKSHYWNLGLMLLLQQKEEEAQTTWLLAMIDGTANEIEQWTVELTQVLEIEAQRREALGDNVVAWALRQHIREIIPTDINNLLHLILRSIELENFSGDELSEWGVIEILGTESPPNCISELLLQVLQNVLDYAPRHTTSLELAQVCLSNVQDIPTFINTLLRSAIKIGYSLEEPTLAAKLTELCLHISPGNPEVLRQLATFYQNARNFDKGIETAKLCYSLLETLPEKVFANHLMIRGLMGAGGYWGEAFLALKNQEALLLSLIEEPITPLAKTTVLRLLSSTYFLPYFRDTPQKHRFIQNQIAQRCQLYIQDYAMEQVEKYRQINFSTSTSDPLAKPLKIGYLSYCLRRHSVGWLARWIFEHYDHDRFQIHAYLVGSKQTNDNVQDWYVNQADKVHKLGMDGLEIAEKIYQDEIDILVDLDSLTLDTTCNVMAIKPAPVQLTWLGWDASGLPAIDYFIADPYVLPESAQDYYSETIWRLPNTYIAVDGFEVGVPTLRRDQLDIPSDAVVYLTAQRGYKLHPDTMRLQMKIIKEVQNSYFLVKGLANEQSIRNFCTQMAEEEGVDPSRLRFLPEVALESIHRANLGIADVVLDTYPYNGATTTLETLWMCIPLVTRVGQQFAARNSYTMMLNAGITEGIAWTDEEYVEWGVRLGKDEAMRQQIAWKLRQSKQTAPLWNAKQFTREMEKAYQQMWANYVEGSK